MTDAGSSKADVLRDVMRKFRAGEKGAAAEFQDFVKAQNDGASSGLNVGDRIPDFALPDQNGQQRHFRDLVGHEGLLLVFTRSADW